MTCDKYCFDLKGTIKLAKEKSLDSHSLKVLLGFRDIRCAIVKQNAKLTDVVASNKVM